MSAPNIPQITLYRQWLRETRGLDFDSYDALWRWSVTDLSAFWQSVWDYFDLQSPTPHTAVLADNRMPGARWFPGAQFNYAHQVLRHVALGLSNKEIGKSLSISIETVKEHVQNILRKINVVDRTQAAVWAVRKGLV